MTASALVTGRSFAVGQALGAAILASFEPWLGPDTEERRRLIAASIAELFSTNHLEVVLVGDQLQARALPRPFPLVPFPFLHVDHYLLLGLLDACREHLNLALRPFLCPACGTPVAIDGLPCAACDTLPESLHGQ